ncbi:hypothetical protein HNP86_001790 [Methanococcus maripaludis]|uniref:Uncharacterized protein n=1 Tax=Methanococcus maripaludis TaxID=39152 RepID=A0A7J9NWD9_METMI|nr:hypothetical protein [Methanococcus maripaludis]MBA2851631.1 hypothetical protein [Methanococcus maripaludis]
MFDEDELNALKEELPDINFEDTITEDELSEIERVYGASVDVTEVQVCPNCGLEDSYVTVECWERDAE